MQLPRGTFREIRKNVTIESLLAGLESEKFSGISNISSPDLTGTLVFKAGKCILVKFKSKGGDAGWEELQKATDEEIDAVLSTLDDAQSQLALEFNKSCRVVKAMKSGTPPSPQKPAQYSHQEAQRPVPVQKSAVPQAPLKRPVKPAPVISRMHPPQVPATSPPVQNAPPQTPLFANAAAPVHPPPQMPVLPSDVTKKKEADNKTAPEQESSSFESDIDTFDTMDLDNVTDKIRSDCKTMIKQLHLDHLMER
jgi:hypothetical protein